MSPMDNTWKEAFFQDDFKVDNCLSKLTQKTTLDNLKCLLKNYGDELHHQMSEILKTETEAIVNLAEYLTNLNTKIDNLSISVSQLQEELKTFQHLIKLAETDYKKVLERKQLNENEKKFLLGKLDFFTVVLYVDNIIERLETENLIDLERAVLKYSFHRNYLSEIGFSDMTNEVKNTENELLMKVNQRFLIGLDMNDAQILTRCLRMYLNLDKQKDAEKFYRNNVVRAFLQPIYTEKNLNSFNQDINVIYKETLNFLNSHMKILNSCVNENIELKKCFNFVLNSFWIEVDHQCRKGLPHITAPGNPELFQKRFINTWNFLIEIAKNCGDENLIRTNQTFQEHIKRFNLPVYFEIRFQQIASQFESDLLIKPEDPSIFIGENDFGFKLNVTLNLYVALKKCFDNHIFIDQLADHFLKFSMFLLSRYIKWFKEALKKNFNNKEKFIINSLDDMQRMNEILCNKHRIDSNENIYKIFPNKMKPVILKVNENNREIIEKFSKELQNSFVTIKVKKCLEQLQNVSSIPRLFRRTNRNPPKEPSGYMTDAVQSILEFYENYKNEIGEDILMPLADEVIIQITRQYSTFVQDLLRSVCKTEESLRRLKNSRNTPTNDEPSSNSSEIMSDEMKIRQQIKLDINYFIEKLNSIASTKSSEILISLKENIS